MLELTLDVQMPHGRRALRAVHRFAFWGHALLSARTVSSLSFTVLACISSGSGRGFRSRGLLAASERKAPLWLRQRSYANLVAPRDLQSDRQQQFRANLVRGV